MYFTCGIDFTSNPFDKKTYIENFEIDILN
jgi:hypothetical protein